MKQETLEQAAERYVDSFEYGIAHPRRIAIKSFINGAKWQQLKVNQLIKLLKSTTEYEVLQSFRDKVKILEKERMYSEEEVFKLLMDFWMEERAEYKMNPVCVSNWFEQFKKK